MKFDFTLILQTLITPILFLLPGRLILGGINRDFKHLSPSILLGISAIISSLVVAIISLLISTIFSPQISKILFAILLISLFVFFVKEKAWKLKFWNSDVSKNELFVFGTLLFIYALFAALLPLSPYPSQIRYNLGDWPEYYLAIFRLAEGKAWAPDYFIADHHQGWLSYIRIHSLLIYNCLALSCLFAKNFFLIHLYCFFITSLCLLLFGAAINSQLKSTSNNLRLFTLCLVPLTFQKVFVLLGLGTTTMPILLGLLLILNLLLLKKRAKNEFSLISLALLYMSWARPEGALFAVILLLLFLMRKLLIINSKKAKYISLSLAIFASLMLWTNLDRTFEIIERPLENAAVFFVKYDTEKMTFDYSFKEKWWKLNEEYNAREFSENRNMPLSSQTNPDVAHEIKDHFLAFSRFISEKLKANSRECLKIFGLDSFKITKQIPALLLFILLIYSVSILSTNNKTKVISFYSSLVLLIATWALINPTIGLRHLLPYSILLLVPLIICAKKICFTKVKLASQASFTILLAVVCFLIFDNTIELGLERDNYRNKSYLRIAKAIEKYVPQNELIISTYPQLISLITGRQARGGSFLHYFLADLAHKPNYCKSYLILDKARAELNDNYNHYKLHKNEISKLWNLVFEDKDFVLLKGKLCS